MVVEQVLAKGRGATGGWRRGQRGRFRALGGGEVASGDVDRHVIIALTAVHQ